MNHPPQLVTVGRIVAETGGTRPRVEYLLRTRQHIQPVALAGRTRLYRQQAIAQVRYELNALDARRTAGGDA